ncbi:MAG: class II aldolase/adducin family protein [Lautropia sp.]|nr:class II aldolase/adducin family protein [Lautropia sp.]
MNHSSENAARLSLMRSAAQLSTPALDPFGCATMSMRWSRPAADGLLLVSAAACIPFPGAAIAGMPDPTAVPQVDAADGAEGHDPDIPVWYPLHDAPASGMHGALYDSREDAGAIVMLASPYAATLACTPAVQYEGIPFFHPMVAMAGRDRIECCRAGFYAALNAEASAASVGGADGGAGRPTAPSAPSMAGTSALELILDALGGGSACLVAHYGLLALGETPEVAVLLAQRLEALCRIYWQVLQVGGARAAPIPAR